MGRLNGSPFTALLTERSIINFLIWTAGLIAAPYIAVTAIYGNYVPSLVVLGIAAVVAIFAFWKDGICVLPLVSTFCVGRLNFIPLKLGPADLAPLAVLGYYLISYLALRRKLMRAGPLVLAVPIIAIALIILHDEPNFGVRLFGGAREGGRGSLFMIIAALAYLCGVSMNSPSAWLLSLTPALAALGSVVFLLPYVLTTYIPSLAPYVYLISDSINTTAYSSDVMNSGEVVRSGGQATAGIYVIGCLMAYYPLTTWLAPKRWWIMFVALACFGFVLLSGYRSMLVDFSVVIFASAWCFIGWRSLLLLPTLAFGVALVTMAFNSHLIPLPAAAQRTLSFLPGDWDPGIKENTDASNDFRRNIIHVYMDEYARQHPWLGNGISYDASDAALYLFMETYHETPDNYWQSKEFITVRMPHTGWVSMYDSIGIIGSACFIFLCGTLLFLTGRSVFQKPMDRSSLLFPLKVWLFAFTTTKVVTFFLTYGDMKVTFPILCFVAIVWYHLNRLERMGVEVAPRKRPVRFESRRLTSPVSA